jgi:hypothetical protein
MSNFVKIMQSLKIVAVEDPRGGYSGFLKDRPNIIAEGNSYPELVQNLINLVNAVNEQEKKKEKN